MAARVPGTVPARDTEQPARTGPVLLFPTLDWHAFLAALKDGIL